MPGPEDRSLRIFAWTVAVLGSIAIALSVWEVYSEAVPSQWIILALLSMFTGFFVIRVPSLNVTISLSETFVFASALLFGPGAATVAVVADSAVVCARNTNRKPYQLAFNVAEPAISVWMSAQLFYLIADVQPLFGHKADLWSLLVPLAAFATTYFVLNGLLTAKAIELETKVTPREFLRSNAPHLALNFGVSLFLLVLVVSNADNLTFASLGIVGPVLALSYYSSKTTMQSVQKSNEHLSQLSAMYLSTVEALAMAIDAKDQVTHGHIRRVQNAVVVLAQEMGVEEESELNAIRAAALLHDLGKIAIPEHILNKPDRLTEAEFEQMKAHSDIGADMIARIDFPYPVEPIVRHHHEFWDGAGYPAGLSGTDIPIGCRVLSVVDCFDALRSHRPYRRQLAEQEAIEIIQSRSGTHYDPAVVDAFLRIQSRLELGDAEAESSAAPMYAEGARLEPTPDVGAHPTAGERPGLGLPSWVSAVAPDALAVLYRCDLSRNVLSPVHVSHGSTSLSAGLAIPIGQRISGWVAAHQQTIVNADAQLDFLGEIEECDGLRKCLCVGVGDGPDVSGVLSLYVDSLQGFSAEQTSVIERMAPELASLLCAPRAGRDAFGLRLQTPSAPEPPERAPALVVMNQGSAI